MNTTTSAQANSIDSLAQSGRSNKLLSADERMQQAVARIDASRAALIVGLSPAAPRRVVSGPGVLDDDGLGPSFAQSLAARIERNGLVQGSWRTLRALARRWWTSQPWHSSVDLIGQTLVHEARPLMQRHPLGTLAVGTVVGAGLVVTLSAARPWAWRQTRSQAASWKDRVGSLLWTQLTSAPLQMALAGALAAWLADQGSRKQSSSKQSKNDPQTNDQGVVNPSYPAQDSE